MSIRSLSEADLRALVKWGSPQFAAQAQAELERRAAEPATANTARPAQKGRWDE